MWGKYLSTDEIWWEVSGLGKHGWVVAALRAELRFMVVYLVLLLLRILFCNFFMSMQVPATLVSSSFGVLPVGSFYIFFSGLVMIKSWC